MTREFAQYTLDGGRRAGRTVEIYMMLMSKALEAVDDGSDEYTALLVRPGNSVRITFKKEPEPEPPPEITARYLEFERWRA